MWIAWSSNNLNIPKLWLSISWYSSPFVSMSWTSYKWKPAEVLSGRPGSFVRITGAEGDCVTWCLHIIKSARDRVRKHIARANLAWKKGHIETTVDQLRFSFFIQSEILNLWLILTRELMFPILSYRPMLQIKANHLVVLEQNLPNIQNCHSNSNKI